MEIVEDAVSQCFLEKRISSSELSLEFFRVFSEQLCLEHMWKTDSVMSNKSIFVVVATAMTMLKNFTKKRFFNVFNLFHDE